MPSRIIREDLIESDRYQSVSIEAKLCFVHLLLLADDFGCVSVSPAFLRRRCFCSSPSDDRITKIILELVDVDLVRTYEVDRRCLAFIPRYRQRLQRSTLKHPKPPESLYKDDSDAMTKFSNINDKNQYSTVAQPLHNGSPTVAQHTKRREEKEEKGREGAPVDKSTHIGQALENIKANLERKSQAKT